MVFERVGRWKKEFRDYKGPLTRTPQSSYQSGFLQLCDHVPDEGVSVPCH